MNPEGIYLGLITIVADRAQKLRAEDCMRTRGVSTRCFEMLSPRRMIGKDTKGEAGAMKIMAKLSSAKDDACNMQSGHSETRQLYR